MKLSDDEAQKLFDEGRISHSPEQISKMNFEHYACAWCSGAGIKAEDQPYLSYNDPTDGGDGAYHYMQVFSHPKCQKANANLKRWTYRVVSV